MQWIVVVVVSESLFPLEVVFLWKLLFLLLFPVVQLFSFFLFTYDGKIKVVLAEKCGRKLYHKSTVVFFHSRFLFFTF